MKKLIQITDKEARYAIRKFWDAEEDGGRISFIKDNVAVVSYYSNLKKGGHRVRIIMLAWKNGEGSISVKQITPDWEKVPYEDQVDVKITRNDRVTINGKNIFLRGGRRFKWLYLAIWESFNHMGDKEKDRDDDQAIIKVAVSWSCLPWDKGCDITNFPAFQKNDQYFLLDSREGAIKELEMHLRVDHFRKLQKEYRIRFNLSEENAVEYVSAL